METKELQDTDVLCLFGWAPLEISKVSQSFPHLEIFIASQDNPHLLEDFLSFSKSKVFQKFTYLISPSLSPEEKTEFELLVKRCQALEFHTHVESSDYQDLGVRVFENLCKNHLEKIDSHRFLELKNSLKGIPAFICGGGPSLKAAIPMLKQIQGKGAIFAGGAALSSSISFDIGAGIDPEPSSERGQMQEGIEAPFFFQARYSHDLLKKVQGPLFEVPSQSGLGINKSFSFDGGCTVSTFCTALALHLGCSPIFFVGMDLAYGSCQEKYFEKDLKDACTPSIIYEDKHSQKDWVLAVKWLEHLALLHGEVPFYTLSTQGLPLKGIEVITWEEAFHKLDRFFDIKGSIHYIRSQFRQDSLEIRQQKINSIQKSLKSSFDLVCSLLLLFEKEYPRDPSSTGEFLLHLFALYNEIVYQDLLEPLWKVWRFPLERDLSDEYAKKIHQWLFFKSVLEKHGGRVL